MSGLETIVAIIAIISTIGLPVGLGMFIAIKIANQKHKERMAMIAQGLMPIQEENYESKRNKSLRTGFVLAGLGAGLGIGLGIIRYLGLGEDQAFFVIAASILFFMGLGFLCYYLISGKSAKVEG